MNRRPLIALLAASALALGTAACGAGSGGDGAARTGANELRIGLSFGPFTLDPAKDGGGAPNVLRSLTNESLFHMNADYTASPALVSDYKYVGDGNKVFEFTLKKGIRFTDGSPLNAAAVKTWLEYFAKQPGPYVTSLAIGSVETEGEYTVRLNLASPSPIVPLLLSQYGNRGAVSSPKSVADPASLATGTYGVGPYVLDPAQSVTGDHYTLVPSKHYHDPSAVRFKKVTVRIIPNPSAMLRAFQAEQIDFGTLDPSTAPAAEKAGVKVMHWRSGTVAVTLADREGTATKPLGDVRVRQALNYAVDREAITKAMVGEYGRPTSQYQTEYTDPALENRYPYDPKKAKALLAEAGYAKGFSMNVVDPGGLVGNWGDPTMQAVAKDWEKIGVRVKVTPATTDFVQQALSKKFAAFEWTPDTSPTVLAYSTLYGPKASINPFGASNAEIDALYRKGQSQQGGQAAETFRKLNSAVTEQAFNVPIYEYHIPWGMNEHITGVKKGSWVVFGADLGWKG
ncbi:ABC transporter substrate-binding protein [Streptomyces deccanensis]|uniref:ABC transporter substrate-binding protein n=1 Tax=Streptomyces deccanensis TaxID=424188 RepID=UPI001EFB8809|nr:ABC transporter substrate-binding protein [Streptomyces deccanensis]ULR48304.1 ABC transporter substrate-binding protein [Streptomyces deccanensis]